MTRSCNFFLFMLPNYWQPSNIIVFMLTQSNLSIFKKKMYCHLSNIMYSVAFYCLIFKSWEAHPDAFKTNIITRKIFYVWRCLHSDLHVKVVVIYQMKTVLHFLYICNIPGWLLALGLCPCSMYSQVVVNTWINQWDLWNSILFFLKSSCRILIITSSKKQAYLDDC